MHTFYFNTVTHQKGFLYTSTFFSPNFKKNTSQTNYEYSTPAKVCQNTLLGLRPSQKFTIVW